MSSTLDADQLEDLLEDILWAETSSKRSSAESLARLSRPQQEFALHWVRALEKDNTACAFRFLTHAYRALSEAKRSGIHPFCITIDKEGQDCLPHMYGAVNHTIVDAVERLPYKVSEIYRRLTV